MRKKYLIVFTIVLIIEIIIALFVKDTIIRPYVGDILVVILVYSFIRSIVEKRIKFLPIYVLIFATMVEIAQYYRIVEVLNLNNYRVISIIIGASFDFKDILCYIFGAIILLIWEEVDKKLYL